MTTSTRHKKGRVILISAALLFALNAVAADEPKSAVSAVVIAPQSLATALQAFSEQSGLQIGFEAALAKGLQTRGTQGARSVAEALNALLAGTGLEYRFVNEQTVVIRQRGAKQIAASSPEEQIRLVSNEAQAPKTNEATSISKQPDPDVAEVVVTGTNIRGARPSAPLINITQDDLRLSGHATLAEAIRALPQNFAGGQNPGVTQGASAGSPANQNITGGSSLNLRGLGPDATLTLLNGARLPYDGFVQATDLSVIPVAAIERMEILLDGASAIYGSDAVGGVANIVLKRDYNGVEISARYGAATEGGYEQQQYNGVGGFTWESGGLLVAFDHARSNPVLMRQREYLRAMPNQQAFIYPKLQQNGGLISGHQRLGENIEVAMDAFYTERQMNDFSQSTAMFYRDAPTTVYGITPSVRFDLPRQWSVKLHGFVGSDKGDNRFENYFIATSALISRSGSGYWNDAQAVGAQADGPLFALPGGAAKVSVGGGERRNTFENADLITGAVGVRGSSRSRHAFAEINLPVLSTLALNGAIRHEDYGRDGFGTVETPKLGVLWNVLPSLDFKVSWGESFKAPTLQQQYGTQFAVLVAAPSIGATGAPAGSTAFIAQGGNRDVGPERAETFTAGLVFRPTFAPRLNFELGWFQIDYKDRVVLAATPTLQAYFNPATADFLTLNPSPAQLAALIANSDQFLNISGLTYDPGSVIAIVDNRSVNAAEQKVQGVDFSARYTVERLGGIITFNGNLSWLDSQRKLTSRAVEAQTAGVVFHPAEFRGRAGAAWTREGLTIASYVNHIDGIMDTNITPNVARGSMTTLDMVFDYQLDSSLLGKVGLNLAATNALDRHPPFVQPILAYTVNYDATNYSALGRVLSATITKRF